MLSLFQPILMATLFCVVLLKVLMLHLMMSFLTY